MSSSIDIKVDKTGHGSTVVIDGEDISYRVRALTLEVGVGQMSQLVVLYGCVEGSANGEAWVRHVCPLAEEGDANGRPK